MKERPILFSAPMVRAILEGRKTQTRRVVKPQPPSHVQSAGCVIGPPSLCNGEWWWLTAKSLDDACIVGKYFRSPYGVPGDRLWVRETHITGWPAECGEIQQYDDYGNKFPMHCWYRATPEPDGSFISSRGERIVSWLDANERTCDRIPWKPSIHMPRWASRITLEVVSVRVERLQEISEEDAKAEGVDSPAPMHAFLSLWVSINGCESWAANPWVWVVEFKRLEAQ